MRDFPSSEITTGNKKEKIMEKYMHVETGSVDTRDGWISSYDPQELEDRGITAEQAFDEDEGVTLIEIDQEEV